MDDFGKKSLDIIVSSSHRMKNFITSLLEYSKIGKQIAKNKVEINKLLENINTDLQSLILEKQASIKYVGEDIELDVVEDEFIKVFQNLIVNAIKYQRIDSNPIIIIDGKEQKNSFLFSVTDNGIGISEEYFDKIFEIFQRLHTRDEYEGTGIGLSYCKKIVELHKGKIWLESEEGEGTTFYFTISK